MTCERQKKREKHKQNRFMSLPTSLGKIRTKMKMMTVVMMMTLGDNLPVRTL